MKTSVLTIPFNRDLLKSTRDNIISTALSIPVPKDATCYLCGGGDLDAAPLVRDCSCKGDNGWAHMKSYRSAFNNSKAGLTQLDINQPHHITAGTPRGEEIVSKQTSTLRAGRHQSSDTPPNIISSYTRSSKDMSEWSGGSTYMDARIESTSSHTQTLKVPIDQVAIVIADLILSDVLVTDDDKDNLHIFHDFKKRTALFSNKEDGFSGHLLLISSGRAKAAATPITTRLSGYSIAVQIYRDLCLQAGVLSRFSRDIYIDPVSVARAEDERRLAREIPNQICNKKLKDLERKQLDESTQLLNSTLKNFSWTCMDRFFSG